MKLALQECVKSEKYLTYNFDNDVYAPRILTDGNAVAATGASASASAVSTAAGSLIDCWSLMEKICEHAGPLLLLIRLGDLRQATLSKLRGTVDYMKTLMVVTGDGSLEDQIAQCFHKRVKDLESPVADCAYMIDPQFIAKSREAPAPLMKKFWQVSRKILGHAMCDDEWLSVRSQLATELQAFRMKAGGFALEDYTMADCVTFWGIAGCHAPLLKKIAFSLATQPVSSSEAERNWFELKSNKTKKRNRLGKETIEKLIFVRRFLLLERKLITTDITDDAGFNKWVTKLLRDAAQAINADLVSEGGNDEEDIQTLAVFNDSIEPGEQGKINGREPGEPRVNLTQLRKDKNAMSWLFEKYYNMAFVDKNPEEDSENAPPLADESKWEHRRIVNVVWARRVGHVVGTCIIGDDSGDTENYFIDVTMLQMIRASPYNSRQIKSKLQLRLNNSNADVTQPDSPQNGDANTDSDTVPGEIADC